MIPLGRAGPTPDSRVDRQSGRIPVARRAAAGATPDFRHPPRSRIEGRMRFRFRSPGKVHARVRSARRGVVGGAGRGAGSRLLPLSRDPRRHRGFHRRRRPVVGGGHGRGGAAFDHPRGRRVARGDFPRWRAGGLHRFVRGSAGSLCDAAGRRRAAARELRGASRTGDWLDARRRGALWHPDRRRHGRFAARGRGGRSDHAGAPGAAAGRGQRCGDQRRRAHAVLRSFRRGSDERQPQGLSRRPAWPALALRSFGNRRGAAHRSRRRQPAG